MNTGSSVGDYQEFLVEITYYQEVAFTQSNKNTTPVFTQTHRTVRHWIQSVKFNSVA